jgi:hypothetical protein
MCDTNHYLVGVSDHAHIDIQTIPLRPGAVAPGAPRLDQIFEHGLRSISRKYIEHMYIPPAASGAAARRDDPHRMIEEIRARAGEFFYSPKPLAIRRLVRRRVMTPYAAGTAPASVHE